MKRKDKARELFQSGYNCAQAVVGAYSDLFGTDSKEAMRAAECFGGGMGRMRLTCGAVSGMFMVASLKYSKGEPKDTETRTKIYETVREMAKRFEDKNGTIVCGELLGLDKAEKSAQPEARTEAYYKKRPCIGCVEDCAGILEEMLNID